MTIEQYLAFLEEADVDLYSPYIAMLGDIEADAAAYPANAVSDASNLKSTLENSRRMSRQIRTSLTNKVQSGILDPSSDVDPRVATGFSPELLAMSKEALEVRLQLIQRKRGQKS